MTREYVRRHGIHLIVMFGLRVWGSKLTRRLVGTPSPSQQDRMHRTSDGDE